MLTLFASDSKQLCLELIVTSVNLVICDPIAIVDFRREHGVGLYRTNCI